MLSHKQWYFIFLKKISIKPNYFYLPLVDMQVQNSHRVLGSLVLFILDVVLYTIDAATSSGIFKAKQKLGRTFNSDKLGGIAFTKISKLTMSSA